MSDIADKLSKIADENGCDSVDEMLENYGCDGVVPGICMNPGCSFITNIEPDQSQGYCETCATNTVSSCLVLAGVI